MSLVRAFTTHRNKFSDVSLPMRFGSIRGRKVAEPRVVISGPVELTDTSNKRLSSIPDVAVAQRSGDHVKGPDSLIASSSASTGSRSSADCTDMSLVSDHSDSASSTDSSPHPERMSVCYFSEPVTLDKFSIQQTIRPVVASVDDAAEAADFITSIAPLTPPKSLKRASSVMLPAPSNPAAPQLPKRALSHSKREHERMARQRSVRMSLNSSSSCSLASSLSSSSSEKVVQDNSTGSELQQLSEIAEDSVCLDFSNLEADVDVVFMREKGLGRFSANDYACEIESLMHGVFDDEVIEVTRPGSGWF